MKFVILFTLLFASFIFITTEGAVRDREKNCDPELCTRIRCYNVEPDACDKNSEIYVKRDGLCHCCDTCIGI